MSEELTKLENVIFELSFAKKEKCLLKSKKELEKIIKIEKQLNLIQNSIIMDFNTKEYLLQENNEDNIFIEKRNNVCFGLQKLEEHIYDEQNRIIKKILFQKNNIKKENEELKTVTNQFQFIQNENKTLSIQVDKYKQEINEFKSKDDGNQMENKQILKNFERESSQLKRNIKDLEGKVSIQENKIIEKEKSILQLEERLYKTEKEKKKSISFRSAEEKIIKSYGIFNKGILSDCKEIINYIDNTDKENIVNSQKRIIKSLFKAIKIENEQYNQKIKYLEYPNKILKSKNKPVKGINSQENKIITEKLNIQSLLIRLRENISQNFEEYIFTVYFNINYVFRNENIETDERFTNLLHSTIEENLEKSSSEIIKIITLMDISKKYVDEIIYLKKIFQNVVIYN
ncbi:hypothetical protein SLOPH_801 [Spraguea lophii 42_110]|uniref:Uncharacterized protein n=1 Tax=Spraguea lophii (strain 42_110) TaxID=1358809 RepID=S7XF46_SPRLO|nr:hypothetical protein SLOPH_801 [Spraguea lophii 42_110]